MWYRRRMEKISRTDRVRNVELLHKVKEEKNILHTRKRRKANDTGHILHRNCLPKHNTEGKREGGMEVMRRQRRRRKQLFNDLEKTRGYCKLKQEALYRTAWRTRFGRGCGPVARQDYGMNDEWTASAN
jgi:hypothetical protein